MDLCCCEPGFRKRFLVTGYLILEVELPEEHYVRAVLPIQPADHESWDSYHCPCGDLLDLEEQVR